MPKDDVFEIFQHFHAKVERERGKPLKCIRTDNGGEYTSKQFQNNIRSYGIRHEKTVPNTPQHNGVAERMNRTIVDRIRCMLSLAKLPRSFWGEAMRTACYLINLSPSVPLKGDYPERVWTGKDVSYEHLRVFGCKAFVHVPKEQRSKLDNKATQCIFLGYADEEFGYRLWDPEEKKVVRSRDVVFYEDQTIEDFEKVEKPQAFVDDLIDLTPVPPPMPRDDGGEVQEDHGEVVGDDSPVHDDVEQGKRRLKNHQWCLS